MSFHLTLSKKAIVPALLILAIGLSFAGSGVAGLLRTTAQVLLLPLSAPATGIATTVRSRASELGTPAARSDKRVDKLRQDAEALRFALLSERARFEEHLRVDRQRDGLYGQLADFPCKLIPARVVASQSLPYGASRVVRASSVKVGSYAASVDLLTDRSKALPENENLCAMDTKALVGKVVSSGEFTCQLLLVTDPAFKIDALIWRDPQVSRMVVIRRPSGIASEKLTPQNNEPIYVSEVRGDGKGGMTVANVLDDRKVMPSDWIVTTGRSGSMPDRIRIGRVVEVKVDHDHPGMVSLQVRPTADLEALQDVYIVLPLGGGKSQGGGR